VLWKRQKIWFTDGVVGIKIRIIYSKRSNLREWAKNFVLIIAGSRRVVVDAQIDRGLRAKARVIADVVGETI